MFGVKIIHYWIITSHKCETKRMISKMKETSALISKSRDSCLNVKQVVFKMTHPAWNRSSSKSVLMRFLQLLFHKRFYDDTAEGCSVVKTEGDKRMTLIRAKTSCVSLISEGCLEIRLHNHQKQNGSRY